MQFLSRVHISLHENNLQTWITALVQDGHVYTECATSASSRRKEEKLHEGQNFIMPLRCALGVSSQEEKERTLHTLKYATLVWQKRQFMQLCKRKELAFLLEEIIPRIGTPLPALSFGRKERSCWVRRNPSTRRSSSRRIPHLPWNAPLYRHYNHTTAQKDPKNLFWLSECVSKPQIISLPFVSSGSRDPNGGGCASRRRGRDLRRKEVGNARASLARGEHFHNLALPLTRQAAHHFHLQLVEERNK
jgi:hypothetical protein